MVLIPFYLKPGMHRLYHGTGENRSTTLISATLTNFKQLQVWLKIIYSKNIKVLLLLLIRIVLICFHLIPCLFACTMFCIHVLEVNKFGNTNYVSIFNVIGVYLAL